MLGQLNRLLVAVWLIISVGLLFCRLGYQSNPSSCWRFKSFKMLFFVPNNLRRYRKWATHAFNCLLLVKSRFAVPISWTFTYVESHGLHLSVIYIYIESFKKNSLRLNLYTESCGHMAAAQAFIIAPDEASSARMENASAWNLFNFNVELGFLTNIHLLHLRPGTSNSTRPWSGKASISTFSTTVWRQPNHWQMVA